jgi:hypothetical protein
LRRRPCTGIRLVDIGDAQPKPSAWQTLGTAAARIRVLADLDERPRRLAAVRDLRRPLGRVAFELRRLEYAPIEVDR